MKISTHEQGSPEWFKARMGRITASEAHKLLVKGKGKDKVFGGTAESYIYDVASEIITEMPKDDINGVFALEWGKKREPIARASFELQTDLKVDEVGFAIGTEKDNDLGSMNDYLGFSADGIINKERYGAEIKCPLRSEHHLKFICKEEIKKDYIVQCQFSMMLSGFKKWYFISFDDRVSQLPLAYKVIERDEEMILLLKERCYLAIEYVKKIVSRVRG